MVLKENIVAFAWRMGENYKPLGGKVALVRGIRDEDDFDYEYGISQNVRRIMEDLPQWHLIPPASITSLSSKEIKKRLSQFGHETVADLVPAPVAERLKKLQSQWAEGRNWREARSFEGRKTTNTREFFDKMIEQGFAGLSKKVSACQVRAMLDDSPVNVVESEVFHLCEIPIDAVTPTGGRYLSKSKSVGPIIVDKKTTDLEDFDLHGNLGPFVVIEGKHRWLDAKERGDERIKAWVGEACLKELGLV